jgi:hypothetical protein
MKGLRFTMGALLRNKGVWLAYSEGSYWPGDVRRRGASDRL